MTIPTRKEALKCMDGSKLTYQCVKCGNIHKLNKQKLRDDIYADIFCPYCGETTSHLECGQDILDFYRYYDDTLDFRFYDYKTK